MALSHGLDVVDLELSGLPRKGCCAFSLRRTRKAERVEGANCRQEAKGFRSGSVEGKLSVEQLSGVTHEDCQAFSRDFGVLLDVEDLVPGGTTRWKRVRRGWIAS